MYNSHVNMELTGYPSYLALAAATRSVHAQYKLANLSIDKVLSSINKISFDIFTHGLDISRYYNAQHKCTHFPLFSENFQDIYAKTTITNVKMICQIKFNDGEEKSTDFQKTIWDMLPKAKHKCNDQSSVIVQCGDRHAEHGVLDVGDIEFELGNDSALRDVGDDYVDDI